MENFTTKIDLLKFAGAQLVQTKKGKRGVFIPTDGNPMIFVGAKGVYLNLSHIRLKADGKYGDTHLVRGHIDRDTFDAMSEEQRRALPILGNSRPMQTAEMAATSIELSDDDDLPEA